METKWKVFAIPSHWLIIYWFLFSLVKDQTEWINQKQVLRWLKSIDESDSSSQKGNKGNGWSKGSAWNLFGWWLLLGVEEYFSRVPGVIDAVSGYANGKGETTKYELVPQTGHAETSSHHLQCQEGISERIAPALFPDYRPNVEESTRKWSRNTIPNRVSIMFPKKTFQPLIKSLKKKQKIRQTVSSGKRATDQFHQGWGLPPGLSKETSEWVLPYRCQSGFLSCYWC